MDLRSIINTEAGDSGSSNTKQAAPVTPIQAHPPQGFRDYNQRPQASPGKHPSQGPYASPGAYQGSYQGRPPPPPPIQAPPHNDLRSPARSYSAQSPYQHTPSSGGSQYPFPPHQTPQSPATHHPYPPSLQQRDSYPQANAPHIQQSGSYSQISPIPQTPPIGIPGAPHPYLQHSRSQSSLSNTTPTSAQSQQQYFSGQFSQDSPVGVNTFPPQQIPQHQRQQSHQSQPGTPLGPPPNQRQTSVTFPQPSSPFQQRGSSGPFQQYHQTSPAPPAPPSLPRLPSTPSAYDSHRTSLSDQQRRSQSERERSLSVSPKTRLPSLPRPEITTPQSENGYIMSSTKRKIDEREMPIELPRRVEQPGVTPTPAVNGDGHIRIAPSSPQQPPKKRIRFKEPPIWAQSIRTKGNISLLNQNLPKVNGKQPAAETQPQVAAPSVLVKTETNGNRQASPAVAAPAPPSNESPASILLGAWEPSITGEKPVEQITKTVADFIYLNVVSRPDLGELASRGVDIEIEAKLGQLIEKDTNQRVQIPVLTECVLPDRGRIGFISSMTEAQHKHLNDFLNQKVQESHPANRGQRKKRVQIDYLHRRETDKFYELPQALHTTMIPAAVREKMNPRHAVKIRVTHDQKDGRVLNKILKVRLADLDIHNPRSPMDCRISINFEMRYDGSVEELLATGEQQGSPDRSKDRLSYTQSHYQIDLTQVTQTKGGHTEREHELEIEVSADTIRDQGQRAANQQPNAYLSLVEGLIDNVRILSRVLSE